MHFALATQPPLFVAHSSISVQPLVPTPPPYQARGKLVAWVRIMAVRTALNLIGSAKPDELEQSLVQAAVDGDDDPELQVLLARCAPLVRSAMQNAVKLLPNKERCLLCFSLVRRVVDRQDRSDLHLSSLDGRTRHRTRQSLAVRDDLP